MQEDFTSVQEDFASVEEDPARIEEDLAGGQKEPGRPKGRRGEHGHAGHSRKQVADRDRHRRIKRER